MKNLIKTTLCLCLPLIVSACTTTNTKLKVHEVNALASEKSNDGEFQGLEFLADPIPGRLKNRVNIFYLHGIGWTENPEKDQLGNNFLTGVAKAYGLKLDGQIIDTPCDNSAEASPSKVTNHIYITTGEEPVYYETTIPGTSLQLNKLVCMDKQTLNVDDNLEYVVYRIFWDDIFWNELQYPHVGQDDARGSSTGIAGLRRKYNRKLKDELVNYGFSDAVMYLGPAGHEIRNAIRGAMCSAALDAAGFDFTKQSHDVAYGKACDIATNTSIRANQFAFVTESLGSKIAFDVMREAMTDGRDTILDDMIAGSETYMLANQIALLSLSDLTLKPKILPVNSQDKARPKIVALSELNDFLTYEFNPFFEQLWIHRAVRDDNTSVIFNAAERENVAKALGFDFIDLRLEFANQIIPLFAGFVDPMQAHMGHSAEPELMMYLLCGAREGKLHNHSCLATSDLKTKK
ncbi:MAG: hypothetical protein ACSHXY_10425 [Alphaproteobacteria bacterium]